MCVCGWLLEFSALATTDGMSSGWALACDSARLRQLLSVAQLGDQITSTTT